MVQLHVSMSACYFVIPNKPIVYVLEVGNLKLMGNMKILGLTSVAAGAKTKFLLLS